MKNSILWVLISLPSILLCQNGEKINLNLTPMWKVCAELRNTGVEEFSDTILYDIAKDVWKSLSMDMNVNVSYTKNERFYKLKYDLFVYCEDFRKIALEAYNISSELFLLQRNLEKGHLSQENVPGKEDQTIVVKTMKLLKEEFNHVFFDLKDLATPAKTKNIKYYLFEPGSERKNVDLKSNEFLVFQITYDYENGTISNFKLNTDTDIYRNIQIINAMPPPPPPPPGRG